MKGKVGIYKVYSDNAKNLELYLDKLLELRKQEDAIIEKFIAISKDLNVGEENRNIEVLRLSAYVYNVMKKAGFNTITDIIVFPASKWKKVPRFGKISAKELETKMRNIGYPTFTIDL